MKRVRIGGFGSSGAQDDVMEHAILLYEKAHPGHDTWELNLTSDIYSEALGDKPLNLLKGTGFEEWVLEYAEEMHKKDPFYKEIIRIQEVDK